MHSNMSQSMGGANESSCYFVSLLMRAKSGILNDQKVNGDIQFTHGFIPRCDLEFRI